MDFVFCVVGEKEILCKKIVLPTMRCVYNNLVLLVIPYFTYLTHLVTFFSTFPFIFIIASKPSLKWQSILLEIFTVKHLRNLNSVICNNLFNSNNSPYLEKSLYHFLEGSFNLSNNLSYFQLFHQVRKLWCHDGISTWGRFIFGYIFRIMHHFWLTKLTNRFFSQGNHILENFRWFGDLDLNQGPL